MARWALTSLKEMAWLVRVATTRSDERFETVSTPEPLAVTSAPALASAVIASAGAVVRSRDAVAGGGGDEIGDGGVELHDIVAHSIGIIAIQAGAGRRVFDARPDEARGALAAIEATSRETLSGLRRMVTGLRRADLEPRLGQAPPGPTPGLAAIERLAASTLEAGVKVDVDWHGSREPLPADIDLSAFRIIQEAVTNVVRHAGTGQCQVCIDRQDGQLSIEVTDSGRGGSGHGGGVARTGYGITGMRERAALLGGDFSAGPRPGGGFRVAVRLPLPAPAR